MEDLDPTRLDVNRDARARRARWLWCAVIAVLFAWTYGPIVELDSERPASGQVEQWFFESQGTSATLVIAIAGWLAWRRRSRLILAPLIAQRGFACRHDVEGDRLAVASQSVLRTDTDRRGLRHRQ